MLEIFTRNEKPPVVFLAYPQGFDNFFYLSGFHGTSSLKRVHRNSDQHMGFAAIEVFACIIISF